MEKLGRTYSTAMAARRGSDLHDFAQRAISLGIRMPKSQTTLNMYVNDAIGFRLTPEQPLFYSRNAFGTADAIGFRKNKLRVHDLKTGTTPTSEHQLEVYCALFCLEYGFKPGEIEMEMRIYQNNEVRIYVADPDQIAHIMSRIVSFDRLINQWREEDFA